MSLNLAFCCAAGSGGLQAAVAGVHGGLCHRAHADRAARDHVADAPPRAHRSPAAGAQVPGIPSIAWQDKTQNRAGSGTKLVSAHQDDRRNSSCTRSQLERDLARLHLSSPCRLYWAMCAVLGVTGSQLWTYRLVRSWPLKRSDSHWMWPWLWPWPQCQGNVCGPSSPNSGKSGELVCSPAHRLVTDAAFVHGAGARPAQAHARDASSRPGAEEGAVTRWRTPDEAGTRED